MASRKRLGTNSSASSINWSNLTAEEKLAVVRNLCGLRGNQLKRRFDGVLAVGAGYKKSSCEISREICIGFLVQKKRKRRLKSPIPSHISAYINRNGRKIHLRIPTDVEELGSGKLHSAINLALGIRASSVKDDAVGVPGAICCVVEQIDQPLNRYVLGCHHVLALSLLTMNCSATQSTIRDRSANRIIGHLFDFTAMSGDGQTCVDAALALVDPRADVRWNRSGVSPSSIDPGVEPPEGCFVYTPDGRLPAHFVKEWANVPLLYPQCGQVVIESAYQFQADTIGGHSGSPVMKPDGTLHGMHFWGDVSQSMAFAIPAFVLFRPGLFSVNFRLM